MVHNLDWRKADKLFIAPDIAFAVIDPIRWPGSLDLLQRHDPEALLLYKGRVQDDLMPLLPRLVRLHPGCPLTDAFLQGTGQGWGSILTSSRPERLIDILADLLPLTNVLLPDKRTAWFRFYDPYILETILRNFDPHQLSLLYGTRVASFWIENPATENWTIYTRPDDLPEKGGPLLTISPLLVERLDHAHHSLFLSELTMYCREKHFPEASEADKPKIARAVLLNVQTAEENGFMSMDHITRFLNIAVAHGADFHLTREAAGILCAGYDLPGQKIAALEKHMRQITTTDKRLFFSREK